MKHIVKIVVLAFLAVPLMAEERTPQEAEALAYSFFNQVAPARKIAGTTVARQLSLVETRFKTDSAAAFYVFNQEGGGFILVSADDRAQDILAYSDKGTYRPDQLNPNMRFWFNRYVKELSNLKSSPATNAVRRAPQATEATTAIAPLLTNQNGKEITWYQEAPYNNLCPVDAYDNTTCLTGCVATGASMIMYHYRYPLHGISSKTYTWEDCIEYQETIFGKYCEESQDVPLSANFATTVYDWDNMLPSYMYVSSTKKQKKAVATLMYHAGVACEMSYGGEGAGGSGAFLDDMGAAMRDYFGYKVSKWVTTASKLAYSRKVMANIPIEYNITISQMKKYFNAELEAKRPILMGGEDEENGGHCFVCDGRDTNGNFHINWGWEGDGNCYCALTSLGPSDDSYDFSSEIDAVLGLTPGIIDTIHVNRVIIEPDYDTLRIYESVQLSATVLPDTATFRAYTWSSSDTTVAVVSANGRVRAIAHGDAMIFATATDNGIQDTCRIHVLNQSLPLKLFTRINSTDQLMSGDEIVLISSLDSVHYAAGDTLTTIADAVGLKTIEVEVVDNVALVDTASATAVFQLIKNGGKWNLVAQQPLGATGKKSLAWNAGTTMWSISFVDDDARIFNGTLSNGCVFMNTNNGTPFFSNYFGNPSETLFYPQIYCHSVPTYLSPAPTAGIATKYIHNGHLVIVRNGLLYDVTGKPIQ